MTAEDNRNSKQPRFGKFLPCQTPCQVYTWTIGRHCRGAVAREWCTISRAKNLQANVYSHIRCSIPGVRHGSVIEHDVSKHYQRPRVFQEHRQHVIASDCIWTARRLGASSVRTSGEAERGCPSRRCNLDISRSHGVLSRRKRLTLRIA